MIEAIAIGDAFEDVILRGFVELPALGEEGYAQWLDREVGGGAVITACGLAQLGHRTSLVSRIGSHDSEWLKAKLQELAVDTSLLQTDQTLRTAVTVSVSTLKDRIYYTYPGANAALEIDAKLLPRARLVHLAARPPARAEVLVRELRERGFFVSLDVGWHPDWLACPQSISCLRELDLFMPNEREAQVLTGKLTSAEILAEFQRLGMSRVALKRGVEGAALLWQGQMFECPAWPVDCRDTTGAGDCFNAGFLAAWLQGQSPQQCLEAGVFCGSQSTRMPGGIAGFPSRQEFTKWQLEKR